MLENKNKTLGKHGEELAVRFLQTHRYHIIIRNYCSLYGEIDIIARQQDTIVFVEVKTRTSSFSQAENSVSWAKQQKMLETAAFYLQTHPEYDDLPTRFDVISIIFRRQEFVIKHLPDAFH